MKSIIIHNSIFESDYDPKDYFNDAPKPPEPPKPPGPPTQKAS
jgi:hypothetical protein